MDLQVSATNVTVCYTHTLQVETYPVGEERLDDQLRRLESLGVVDKESSVYDQFVQRISFDGERYEVGLP